MTDRVDLDDLEKSDAKRTQGEWTQTMGEASKIVIEKGEEYLHVASTRRPGGSAAKRHADASHIVKVVKALPAMIAELRGLREALEEAVDILPSYRVFITTREQARDPEGWVLWDKTIDRARIALDATKKRGV